MSNNKLESENEVISNHGFKLYPDSLEDIVQRITLTIPKVGYEVSVDADVQVGSMRERGLALEDVFRFENDKDARIRELVVNIAGNNSHDKTYAVKLVFVDPEANPGPPMRFEVTSTDDNWARTVTNLLERFASKVWRLWADRVFSSPRSIFVALMMTVTGSGMLSYLLGTSDSVLGGAEAGAMTSAISSAARVGNGLRGALLNVAVTMTPLTIYLGAWFVCNLWFRPAVFCWGDETRKEKTRKHWVLFLLSIVAGIIATIFTNTFGFQ